MTRTEKLATVRKILATNTTVAAWYATEHNVTVDSFTTENVNSYGLDGLGELADSIIEDGENDA